MMNRCLSVLLVLCLLLGSFSWPAAAETPAPQTPDAGTGQPGTAADQPQQENGDPQRSTYYEVCFELPDELKDLPPEEAEEIRLPDTVVVPAGTPVSSLELPERLGYVFVGWYYDAALQTRWAENDVVDRNMTLYPRFASSEEAADGLVINYMSDLDVALDFPVYVVSYDLTEPEVRSQIAVRDLSEFDQDMVFTLEPQQIDPAELIAGEENREAVLAALSAWQREGGSLGAALREAGAEDADVTALQAHYAQDELRAEAETALRLFLSEAGYGTGSASEDLTELMRQAARSQKARNAMADAFGVSADVSAKAKPADLADMCAEAIRRARMEASGVRVKSVYRVCPPDGVWTAGHLHQVELRNTDSIRFIRGGQESGRYVIYYNLTVVFEPFNNMRLRKGLLYIPFEAVEGVDLNDGLFKSRQEESGDMTVERNDATGVLTCRRPVKTGDVLVVYDGELREDGTADRMGYFRITGDLGNERYSYEIPEFADVVFLPDVIPVHTDGSYEDGEIFVSADQFDFTHPTLVEIGLGPDTTVEPGDWIALYEGSLDHPEAAGLVGYGELTQVQAAEGGLQLRYALKAEEDMARLAGMAMRQENVALNLTEEEMKEVQSNAIHSLQENGFFDQAETYIRSMIFDDEPQMMANEDYRRALQRVRFTTDDGEELTLDEVRRLNLLTDRVAMVRRAPIHVRFTGSLGLKHFSGTGVRFELSASTSWRLDVEGIGEDTKDFGINIDILVQLEQEFTLGIGMSFDIDWKKIWFIKIPKDIKGSFSLQAGTFTALGFEVTIGTVRRTPGTKQNTNMAIESEERKNNDTSRLDSHTRYIWYNRLTEAAGELDEINYKLDTVFEGTGWDSREKNDDSYFGKAVKQNGTLGGSLEEKYASFVKSKSEYVKFWEYDVLDKDIAPDPLHLCALGLKITAHASFRLCVVLGASVSYGVCKGWSVKFKVFAWESESSSADLEAPNLNIGAYLFGMLGVRVGLILDFRIGLISTKLASLGAVLEFGLYAEFYGFFYFGYRKVSGEGEKQLLGTALFEIGFYTTVKLKAQAGDDRKKAEKEVFSIRVPFISLGDQYFAVDFEIARNDKNLIVEMKDNTAKMPDSLYNLLVMGMSSGTVEPKPLDGNDRIPGRHTAVSSMGGQYKTYDEDFFEVECVDTDAEGRSLGTSSWTYDPVNNTVTARPKDDTVKEMWGDIVFTFRNLDAKTFKTYVNDSRFGSYCSYGAGIALEKKNLTRTVKVHWVRQDTQLTVKNIYQVCPGAKVADESAYGKMNSNQLRDWYDLGETVNITVPLGMEHGLSLTDPRIRVRKDYVPVMVYSPDELAMGSVPPAADALKNTTARTQWIKDSQTSLWQTVPAEGRTIRIYYNYTGTALKHKPGDPVQENIVSATCTEAGSYDEVVYCKICKGEISRSHKKTAALGHTKPEKPTPENITEATCTEAGSYDEVFYCTVCKAEISRTHRTTAALGHTKPEKPTLENITEAACTKEGSYDEVFYCTACKAEISRTHRTTAALGHTKPEKPTLENITEATCTKEGGYDEVFYCTICKAEISRTHRTTAPLGHTKPEKPTLENITEAACVKEGSADEVFYCSVCGAEISRTKITLPALGHDMKTTETAAEPVMEGGVCVGWKAGSTVTACTRCGEVASTVIHKVETRPAMKTNDWSCEDGILTVTCAVADWPAAKVSDYLAQAGFYGYAGTLNGNDCYTVPGTFSANEGGSAVISENGDKTLSVPVTFTPTEEATYAPCSFTLRLRIIGKACPYVDENGTPKSANIYKDISEIPTDGSASGWYAVQEDFTLSERLVIKKNVNLILCDGKTLTCAKGVQLSGGSLTIWGQTGGSGLLEASAEEGNAGIGGGSAGPMGGSLTVHSGRIRALSSSGAAGIGGGQGQNGGTVTILGGYVQSGAMSNDCAAIGAGVGGSDPGSLVLGDGLKAVVSNFTVEMSPALRNERVESCQKASAAIISPCDHADRQYTQIDRETHQADCKYCLHSFGAGKHQYEDNGSICTLCGCMSIYSVVVVNWQTVGKKTALLYDVPRSSAFVLTDTHDDSRDMGALVLRGWNIHKGKTVDDITSCMPVEGMEIYPTDYSYPVTEDIIVAAVFGTPCKVTFAPGRGSGTMPPVDWYQEDLYPLPACGFDTPEGGTFIGWRLNGAGETLPAGKKVTLTGDTVLTAVWKYEFGTADMTLPSGVTAVEESAFEGMPVKAVRIGDSCRSVGAYAFRGCTGLTRLRLPRDCAMGDGVLEGCGAVIIFAPAGGSTEAWAKRWIESHPECGFQEE